MVDEVREAPYRTGEEESFNGLMGGGDGVGKKDRCDGDRSRWVARSWTEKPEIKFRPPHVSAGD